MFSWIHIIVVYKTLEANVGRVFRHKVGTNDKISATKINAIFGQDDL